MDDIGLYKGKLNEALNIVPTMSEEKKWEAVTYWNNAAVQFRKMVATTGEGETTNEDNSPIAAGSATGGDNSSVIGDKGTDLLDNCSCVGDHQQSASPSLSNNTCSSALLEHVPSDPTTTAAAEVLISPSATTNSAVMPTSPGTSTTVSKHIDVPLESSMNYDNVRMSETLGCPRTAADVADEIGNGQFDRGPTKGTEGAVVSVTSSNYIVETSPAPTAPIIQPVVHQQDHHHSIPVDTTILNTGSDCSQSIMLPSYPRHHLDTYTHSDRPLQQIQPFDVPSDHQHDVVFQDHQSNSENRLRTFVYNNHSNNNSSDFVLAQHQHHLEYSASPVDSCTNYANVFSPSDTPSLMENVSSLDIEQIVDIKRELIVDSELGSYSNESTGSTNASSNGSTNSGIGQQQHTCNVCGKSGFSTKGNLKRHLKAHSGEKPFKCDYCDSCFTEKKSLKIHVRRHTGEKPYKCNVCEKLFSQTGVLQSHMALHSNERKFECQKCGKAFRQRSQLKLHLMRHDGVKRLECQTCNAKFLTKGDLERHCRIHTGEKPYRCELCNKNFTRQQSLNEHMNRHTGRKPYYCKYCDKTFSEMSACYKHAKTHERQEHMQRQQMVLQAA